MREIDGLRALAVLSVLVFHLDNSWLPGGFAGVDVFFVISGYVVTRSLVTRPAEAGPAFFAGFFARRFLRIMPALMLCLVVTTLATVLFIPYSWLSQTTEKTASWAYFGISNFALLKFQDGYFSPRLSYNPFTHTWSLGVEEQFYLVLPIVAFVWLRWRSAGGWKRAIALAALPVLALTSFALAAFASSRFPDWSYYSLATRFWELAAGALLVLWPPRTSSTAKASNLGPVWLTFGTILIGFGFYWSDNRSFPFPWAIAPVLGTVLVLHSLSYSNGVGSRLSSLYGNSVAVYLGKISYSLYLWHWPVYVLLRWTVGLESIATKLFAVAAAVALAAISYHVVEHPIRNSRRVLAQSPILLVLAGLALIGISSGISGLMFSNRQAISLSVAANRDVWQPSGPWRAPAKPGPLPFAGRQIFAIGDSHVFAYSTMFNQTTHELGVRVQQISVQGCRMGHVMLPIDGDAACKATVETIFQTLRQQARAGDIVFFAALRTHRLVDQWEYFGYETILQHSRSDESERLRLLALTEVSDTIARLREAGLNVLIDAPKPVLQAPPYRCSDWFNRGHPICAKGTSTDRVFMDELRAPVMRSLGVLQSRFDNLTVWDPMPVLCPGATCKAFDDKGLPLFFDGDHLSGHGNRVLYPHFEQVLRRIWKSEP